MLTALLYFLIASVISVAILGVLAYRAPLGYEDEDGFHHGTPEDKNNGE